MCGTGRRNCAVAHFCVWARRAAYHLCVSHLLVVRLAVLWLFQSELFQDDLFPDTRVTWEPTLSSEEWFSGVTRLPKLVSLRPPGMDCCTSLDVNTLPPSPSRSPGRFVVQVLGIMHWCLVGCMLPLQLMSQACRKHWPLTPCPVCFHTPNNRVIEGRKYRNRDCESNQVVSNMNSMSCLRIGVFNTHS